MICKLKSWSDWQITIYVLAAFGDNVLIVLLDREMDILCCHSEHGAKSDDIVISMHHKCVTLYILIFCVTFILSRCFRFYVRCVYPSMAHLLCTCFHTTCHKFKHMWRISRLHRLYTIGTSAGSIPRISNSFRFSLRGFDIRFDSPSEGLLFVLIPPQRVRYSILIPPQRVRYSISILPQRVRLLR